LRTSALRALGRELFQALSWGVLWRLKILFSQEANTVVSVLQKGYLIAERVLRPALVIVAGPK
jgi:hypothetical protein